MNGYILIKIHRKEPQYDCTNNNPDKYANYSHTILILKLILFNKITKLEKDNHFDFKLQDNYKLQTVKYYTSVQIILYLLSHKSLY